MRRRSFLTGTGAAATTLLAAGCGESLSTAASGKVSFYNGNPTWKEGFLDAGKVLHRICGYGLKPIAVPMVNAYEQIVKSQVQTSKAPDIVKWWNGYRLKDLARLGQLRDLSGLWDAAHAKGWVDPKIKAGFSYDGRIYALPLHESYYVFFYSKALFAKYDLQPPRSWAEFVSNAATLKKNGVIPFVATQDGGWPALIFFEELLARVDPGYYQRLTAGEASYTDEPMRRTFEIWAEFIAKGYFTKPDLALNDAPAQLKAGTVAMYPAGTWTNQAIQATGMESGKDFGAFLMPTVEESTPPSVITEAATLVVPSRAPDRSATHKVMAHWLDPPVQRVWSSFLQDSSPNPTVRSKDPVIKSVEERVRATDPVLLTRYWEASPPALVEGNVQDLGQFMIHPDQREQIMASMQRRAETEWAYWKEAVS